MDNPNINATAGLSYFIALEKQMRHTQSLVELGFIACNNAKKLIPFDQAIFWIQSDDGKAIKIQTISGAANINYESPELIWLKDFIAQINTQPQAREQHLFTESDNEWLPPHVMWCPLINDNKRMVGGILYAKSTPWNEQEQSVATLITDPFVHAYMALEGEHKIRWWQRWSWRKTFYVLIALLIILAIPVRQTVLAPAEIIAQNPNVVSAPLNGVVEQFLVKPNQKVKAGQPLIQLDKRDLQNEVIIAQKNLAVAREKLRKASQHAFKSEESRSQLSALRIEMQKAVAQLRYNQQLLTRTVIRSPATGVAIFSDPNEWVGKPVKIGEKILEVANPKQKQLGVWLPIADALTLQPGADVKVYLNVKPLSSYNATLIYASYSASMRPDNTYAYRIKATFSNPQNVPRIGLRGTAKIYGDRVSLFYYLFWKPVSALRQFLGV